MPLPCPPPADGKVLMLADGSAVFAQAIGAALDLTDEVRDAWLYGNADAFFFGGSGNL